MRSPRVTSAVLPLLFGTFAGAAVGLSLASSGGARTLASAAPQSPDAEAEDPPPVQIIKGADPPHRDAVPTGGPYFADRLHRLLRDAGLPVSDIQIVVTRAEVILSGQVPREEDRIAVGDIVRRNSPLQLAVDNRIVVRGGPEHGR